MSLVVGGTYLYSDSKITNSLSGSDTQEDMEGKKAVTEGVGSKIPVTEAWLRKHRLLYDGATKHPFVVSIRDGSVDFTSFKRWLVISPFFFFQVRFLGVYCFVNSS